MYVPTVGICARTWAHYNEISHASAQVKTASEDVSLNYVGDFVGDFAPRTYVSMREIVESKIVAAKLFVFYSL